MPDTRPSTPLHFCGISGSIGLAPLRTVTCSVCGVIGHRLSAADAMWLGDTHETATDIANRAVRAAVDAGHCAADAHVPPA